MVETGDPMKLAGRGGFRKPVCKLERVSNQGRLRRQKRAL